MMSSNPAEIQLHVAAHTNNLKAVFHLLNSGSNPNAVLKQHLYPEHLVKNFKVDLWTPLHCAVDVQSIKIVKLLIKHKANLNIEDEYGRTPLNIAASRGNIEIVKLLINSDAHVDSCHLKEDSKIKFRIREPLHAAVESNNFSIVKLLLEKKADVDLLDRWGRTALCLSISEGNSTIVDILLEYGANIEGAVDLTEKELQKTALHHVAEKLQVKIMKLLSTKFDSKFNEINKVLNLCFYRNFNYMNSGDKEKYGCVIEVIKEHDRIVQVLINYDVDVNATDADGFSSLHSACKEGNWKITKTLLENGADLDLQEKTGKTALHLALLHRRRAIVEILLDYEANFLISDNEGFTPVNYQCQFCPDFDLESHVVKIEILKMTEKEYATQDVLSHFERLCLDEIFYLKTDFFQCGKFSYSLYQIFANESNKTLIRLSKNEQFCSEIFSDHFYKKFCIYGDILRGRLEKAKWRGILIDKGVNPLIYVLGYLFPYFVLEEILSNLSNADIFKIIKLYNNVLSN